MRIPLHQPPDRDQLEQAICRERAAEQRDRYRAALLAIQGERNKAIQQTLGRSKRFVERWAYGYREHGLPGLSARPRGGSKRRSTRNT